MIWCLIPPAVLAATLPPNAKLLYGRILGMVDELGACYAGNDFLGEMLGVDGRTVQRLIKDLEDEGFLKVDNSGKLRFLYPSVQGDESGTILASTSTSTNATSESTSTSTNVTMRDVTKERKNKQKKESEIIFLFNFWVQHRNYALQDDAKRLQLTASRRKAIAGRLNDGYTVEDIKMAIMGCLGRDFNVEHGYIDLTLICRADKIEQYVALAKAVNDGTGRPELEEWDG